MFNPMASWSFSSIWLFSKVNTCPKMPSDTLDFSAPVSIYPIENRT